MYELKLGTLALLSVWLVYMLVIWKKAGFLNMIAVSCLLFMSIYSIGNTFYLYTANKINNPLMMVIITSISLLLSLTFMSQIKSQLKLHKKAKGWKVYRTYIHFLCMLIGFLSSFIYNILVINKL